MAHNAYILPEAKRQTLVQGICPQMAMPVPQSIPPVKAHQKEDGLK